MFTYFSDKHFIKKCVDASALILQDEIGVKYINKYFRALGEYQEIFLSKNGNFFKNYIQKIKIENISDQSGLIAALRKNHYTFYKEITTDEYFEINGLMVTSLGANNLSSICQLLDALGNDKLRLINKINLNKLADICSTADTFQLSHLSTLLHRLGKDAVRITERLDYTLLAVSANKANRLQLSQIANILNSLSAEQGKLIEHLDFIGLANTANMAEVDDFAQLADLLTVLGDNIVEKLDLKKLAKSANKADAYKLRQVADILNCLGTRKGEFVEHLDVKALAIAASKANVISFSGLEAIINALAEYKYEFIEYLDFKMLSDTVNNAKVFHIDQIADFLNALGKYSEMLGIHLDGDNMITYSKQLSHKKIRAFCVILFTLKPTIQNRIIYNSNWIEILKMNVLPHTTNLNNIHYIIHCYNVRRSLDASKEQDLEVQSYLETNFKRIIHLTCKGFIKYNNCYTAANLITKITPYHSNLSNAILRKLKFLIPKLDSISPKDYSNLAIILSAINDIYPQKMIFIVDSLKMKLFISFTEKSLAEYQDDLIKLLQVIKKISPIMYSQILDNNEVKKINP